VSFYPDAFTSLVSVPGIGTWIGATPELLMEVKAGSLRTMALAATRSFSRNNEIMKPWGQQGAAGTIHGEGLYSIPV
jgi:isochorismate synthase EntC